MSEARVAVVTGAGQGLGLAIARSLAAAGITVAAVGRTEAKVKKTADQLGGKAIAVAGDLTDPDQVRRVFDTVAERLGRIDILINCAAEYSPFPFDESSDAQIRNMIDQCLTSPIFCMREAVRQMRRHGQGDILNISTQSAELPQPFMVIYGGAKAGLEVVSEGLRHELKGEDIRITVCQIGIVDGTDLSQKPGFAQHGERMMDAWARTGVGPMYAMPGSSPETIAAAVTHVVTAPRDTHFHTIRLRGADLPGPPSGDLH